MSLLKKSLFPLSAIALAVQSGITFADAEFERRVEQRLVALETKQAGTSDWREKISLSALVEVEAAVGDRNEQFEDDSYSSLAVATIEIGLAAEISRQVAAEIVLLYEEGETELDVDSATLRFHNLLGQVNLLIGKQYAPFGRYETTLVNDTLVLALAETNRTGALFGLEQDIFSAGVYVFNGVSDRTEHVENWGLTFSFAQDSWGFGADYISSFAETDGMNAHIVDTIEGNLLLTDADLVEDDGAFAISGKLDLDNVRIMGEYVTALTEIEFENTLASEKFEPEAMQIEVAIDTIISGKEYGFSFAVQQTDGTAGWLPEQRLSLGGSTEIYDRVGLAVEFWHDVDYDQNDGGSGEKSNNIVLQLAAEF